MPNKVAESQFFHVAEKEGLLSLTLSLNGDPLAPDALDNFAFEVHQRFLKARRPKPSRAEPWARAPWQRFGLSAAKQAVRLASWAFPGAPFARPQGEERDEAPRRGPGPEA
jgi:hypothetical protein